MSWGDRRIIKEEIITEYKISYLEIIISEKIEEVLTRVLKGSQSLQQEEFKRYASGLKEDLFESSKLKQEQINHNEKLLDIGELAAKFTVSKQTVHNWIKRRIITGKKMGKGRFFSVREVEESLEKKGFRHRS
ncbi:helix-turn-helix domain-containing protein [Mucilaginibacter arboris]|nr:helix-turn-helix domain-containing protein [Mucilaginibacter arboris]